MFHLVMADLFQLRMDTIGPDVLTLELDSPTRPKDLFPLFRRDPRITIAMTDLVTAIDSSDPITIGIVAREFNAQNFTHGPLLLLVRRRFQLRFRTPVPSRYHHQHVP